MIFRSFPFCLIVFVLSSLPIAAQDTTGTTFRFFISGPGIGNGAENIEVELFVRGGANLAPSERDQGARFPMRDIFENARHQTRPIELRDFLSLQNETESVLVYGQVRDLEDRAVAVAYIPVTLIRVTPGEAVVLNLRTVDSIQTFFLDSHPFRLQADTGLMNDDNAREILLALRLIFEYFLSENEILPEEEWSRFNSFLRANQDYLISGDDELVVEILNYLSSSSALSNSHVFLRYYGLYLKELLVTGSDRELGNDSLGARIVEDLRRLYQTRFKSSYFSADNVLEGLMTNGMTEACLELAGVSLNNLDTAFFNDVVRYNTDIQFLLVNSLRCAIADYSAANDGAFPTSDALADYLFEESSRRQYMFEFVRVVDVLQREFNALQNRNERDLIIYGSAFSTRLGA